MNHYSGLRARRPMGSHAGKSRQGKGYASDKDSNDDSDKDNSSSTLCIDDDVQEFLGPSAAATYAAYTRKVSTSHDRMSQEAMDKERDSLEKNQVFLIVVIPQDRRCLISK